LKLGDFREEPLEPGPRPLIELAPPELASGALGIDAALAALRNKHVQRCTVQVALREHVEASKTHGLKIRLNRRFG
jgi:hypothetical protein